MRGIGLNLFPELVDKYAQVFRLIPVIRAPDRLEQATVLDGFALIRDELSQEFELFWRQPNRVPLDKNPSPFEVNFQAARDKGGKGLP